MEDPRTGAAVSASAAPPPLPFPDALLRDLSATDAARLRVAPFTLLRLSLGESLPSHPGLLLLAQGRLRCLNPNGRTAGLLLPGDTWGAEAHTGAPPLPANSHLRAAAEETLLLHLPEQELAPLLAAAPTLADALRHRAATRFTQAAPTPTPITPLPPPTPPAPTPTAPSQHSILNTSPVRPRGRHYPEVRQATEVDCGAACIAMLLRRYGARPAPRLATLRDLANVDRDGATLASLADAAERLGFRARGVRGTEETLLRTTAPGAEGLPAIAHWRGDHYVVLWEVKARHGAIETVTLGDPAVGTRQMPWAEFTRGWTGNLLLLTPTGDVRSATTALGAGNSGVIAYLGTLLRPHTRVLVEIFLASLLLQALGLTIPLFTQVLIDRVIVHEAASLLAVLLIGMGLVALGSAALTAVRQYLLVHTMRRVDLAMLSDFYRHVLSLPLSFFEQRRTGDLIQRFTEGQRLRDLLTGRAITALLDAVMLVAYLALMLYTSLTLTGVALLFAPFYAALAYFLTPLLRRQYREVFEKTAAADAHLVESLSGIGTVKASAAERAMRSRFESLTVSALNIQFRSQMVNAALFAGSSLLQTATVVTLLGIGAGQVIRGAMTLGQLVAFNVLVSGINRSLAGVIDVAAQLQEGAVTLERITDILETAPEGEGGGETTPRLPLPPLTGRIAFENVTFRYPGRAGRRNALQNVTLTIEQGETIAFVGRSGAGKTTLANLLLGLYTPTEGRILLDGHDIRHADLASLRRQVGVVSQDVFLFSGTVRENIAFGRPDVPLTAVREAARLAGAHEFLSELPQGYNTRIGERGQSLSGGQRQRIAIARALLSDPPLLIFDEATSALDSESERAVQANLHEIAGGRTLLLIAHRLSSIRNADRIVVLDRGAITEQGTHEELMARRGLYFYLHQGPEDISGPSSLSMGQ